MKNPNHRKDTPKNSRDDSKAQGIAVAISAVLCVILLAFTALDCEKYEKVSVPAAITYTEPDQYTQKGFWELFSEAVIYIFMPRS